ncbi:hypothetical protein niasHS_009639 [Heterodera schachtii]|uniref:BTB domain-containing protein n=1 Tax=Heterodera schachtii TaxID=97005 RepID=A0ABD2J716_HETSC
MSKLCPVSHRIGLLLGTGKGADVHFLVGREEEKEHLSAHKLILASASEVFEAMFRFDEENETRPPARKVAKMANSAVDDAAERDSSTAGTGHEHDPVVIPDVTVEAFKAMLEFIYMDELSGMDGLNLFDVLYAAKKYQISLLIAACTDFPIWKIPNVFEAFAQAQFVGEEKFASRCLEDVDFDKADIMQAFLQIDQQLLCEILCSLPQKPSGEIAIWNAALRWADEQCAKNGKECTGENRREVLGPALYKIRFPLISRSEFSKNIVPSDVLTRDELLSVFLSFEPPDHALPELYPLRFRTAHRKSASPSDSQQKGRLTLKIEKFSEFSRGGEAGTGRHSDAVNIRGFSFKIMANTYTMRADKSKKCLGFYIECNKNVPSDVLTKDEMLSVFLSYSQSLPAAYPLHFPTDQRIAVQKSPSNLLPRDTALNKRSGRITMKIENFFEFARENKRRYSDAVNIRGFSWRIFAEIQTTTMCDGNKNKKYLGIFLHCEEPANKECNWCCNCSATLQIVGQKKNKDSKAIQFTGLTFKSVKPNSWGWSEFVTFEQLMNPANGWYNEKDDSVILAADVSTYSPAYPHSWSQQKR